MREEKIFFLPSSVQVPRRQDMSFAYFVFSGKHKITLQNYHKLEMFQKKKIVAISDRLPNSLSRKWGFFFFDTLIAKIIDLCT